MNNDENIFSKEYVEGLLTEDNFDKPEKEKEKIKDSLDNISESKENDYKKYKNSEKEREKKEDKTKSTSKSKEKDDEDYEINKTYRITIRGKIIND